MGSLIELENIFFENPIWQIIWLIAFILWVIAFLHKKDKNLYIWIMVAQICWVIHFLFIWLYIWAFVNIIWILRSFVALKYKHVKQFIFIFIFFYLIIGFLDYNTIVDIFPVLAWILWTLAFLYFSWLKWRIILLVCSSLWLIYNYIWDSIGWVVTEIFMIISWLITIFRLIKNKNEL